MKLFALLALLHAASPTVRETLKTLEISTTHYVAVITKTPAGLLTSLRSPDARTRFVADHSIYTDFGIYGPGRGYVGTRDERSPRVRVQRAAGKVVVTTTGHLRGRPTTGKKLSAYRVVYTFDASPRIAVLCEVTPAEPQPEVRAFLATYFHVPQMREWAANTLDGIVREDRVKRRARSYQARLLPLDAADARVGFMNQDNTSLLVSDIRWDVPVSPQNVIIHDTAFFFAWLDGEPAQLVAKPHRVRFVLTVGKGDPMR